MAARFWVGGTGTWDASTTTHWSATTGGAGGASVPGSSDDVTFDGASGGGTITITANPNIQSLTTDTFTGTFGNATDNYNMTLHNPFSAAWVDFGTGTHTVNMGLGTWTITAASQTGCLAVYGATTNLTFHANSSTVVFAGFTGSAETSITILGNWNAFQINAAGRWRLSGPPTLASLALVPGVDLVIPANQTLTITAPPTWAGTRAAPIIIDTDIGGGGSNSSLAIGSGTLSLDWGIIIGNASSGGTARNATNTVGYGTTTGWNISSGPSAGGGTGGHFIGG
jgi:hypothetical protein